MEVGQHDRIFHVEAFLPSHPTGVGTERRLIAYGFNMVTNEATSALGDVRGMLGLVRGEGGGANLRAVHVLAEGVDGHTGDLSGILATVQHSDEPNGVAGSIGTSIAVIGQVGARCSANLEARSGGGVSQRPAFAFRVRQGGAALLPEHACYAAHGGGNGDMFRGYRDGTSSDITFSVDNNARVMARSFFSGRTAIHADIELTTGILTGTTGTDGKITLSAHSDGKIYIENRLGTSRPICWRFDAAASAQGNLT